MRQSGVSTDGPRRQSMSVVSFFAAMRRLLALAVLFLALYGCATEGEADEGSAAAPGEAEAEEAPMEEKEKRALYAAIESFVRKGWNGSGLFPDPCGQTPIQVRRHISSS
jgi:hypothetical protein